HFPKCGQWFSHSLNVRQWPDASQTKTLQVWNAQAAMGTHMPERVTAGIAECIRIRHLTDANAIKNDQNHAIKSHLAPQLQVLKQIGEPIQHCHLIGHTKILPFALPSPGVRDVESPNASSDGWIDVRSRAVSNHPGVGLRKSMTLDHFLKSVDALFPHNLDRFEEACQA